ncbi:hypothetical protein NLJ89_g9041 [Agrocybe chaxingu]|uniref:Integrase catalytic domain-containing protein n=1 Tax=Agrocybe chaxingu TaxID=84603 RepID=A0A9W8JU97_9AGAR|nr:hypothetical protein NLJ89_g9041 [Agrocybe chaxingu]
MTNTNLETPVFPPNNDSSIFSTHSKPVGPDQPRRSYRLSSSSSHCRSSTTEKSKDPVVSSNTQNSAVNVTPAAKGVSGSTLLDKNPPTKPRPPEPLPPIDEDCKSISPGEKYSSTSREDIREDTHTMIEEMHQDILKNMCIMFQDMLKEIKKEVGAEVRAEVRSGMFREGSEWRAFVARELAGLKGGEGEVEQTAFETLRSAILEDIVLTLPLDNAPFRIEADSSGFATGAVLSQLQEDIWRPVAFSSKSLNDVERNYEIHDRELLSIMRALADWRRYLHGSSSPVEILSDHANLQYFMRSQHLNRRQARWSLELAEYNFTLVHKPGTSMVCSDALSRLPSYDKGSGDNADVVLLKPQHIRRTAIEYRPNSFVDEIRTHSLEIERMWDLNKNKPGWTFTDGVLTWFNRVYVPDAGDLRERVLRANHDTLSAGHPGRLKTIELVQRDFWWPSLAHDARRYTDGCVICQKIKPLRQAPLGLLSPNKSPSDTWDTISADLITDLPRSKGFDSIFVVVDRLSKMVRVVPTKKTVSSEGLARLYRDNVWKDFGLPCTIISDRGPQFVSHFTKALNSLLGISENTSTAFRPQTDGQTERTNQEVEIYLRAFMNKRQNDWAEWLACAEFALNNKISSTTGYSPFFVNYGKNPRRPLAPIRTPASRVPHCERFCKAR